MRPGAPACWGGLGVPDKDPEPNGTASALLPGVDSGVEYLPGDLCVKLFRIMVRARAMEERMIKMSKSGEGYFWIGGP